MRLIDADVFVEAIKDYPYGFRGMIVCDIAKQPTVDAVPVGAYEQTRWERDMAISQLEEIGKSLFEKMDNVATVVRCKECRFSVVNENIERKPLICGKTKMCGETTPDWFCAAGKRSEDD